MSEREDEAGRKLAAVMFTDIVGYTALSLEDESLTLELLEEHRKIIRPVLSKHGGVEIKTIGDAFLIEFPSALGAVRTALDIQRSIHDLNSMQQDPKRRIKLRIGIHLGDVVHRGGDIYGDAVNLASRIQPLAEPGGICVTEQVYSDIRNKIDVRASSLGKRELKNVDRPVEVFKLELTDTVADSSREGFGIDRNRIAVLPLVSMISEGGDEYFADGLTEELTSTISRISGFHVISRTSAARYKNIAKSIADIGKELAVGTVIEGSVRKSGGRIRISVQLIDVRTDEHIWAENYDRQFEDVFAIQSDIAQRVADSLKVQLVHGEKRQVERVATRNSEAHNLYFRGRYFWRQRTKEGLSRAVEFFEHAIEKDPAYALAYSGLADCYTALTVYGHLPIKETTPKQRAAAFRALELDGTLAEAHNSLAFSLAMNNEFVEAEKEFRSAIRLNSNYSTAHLWYAQMLVILRRYEEAAEEVEKARQLDPLSGTTIMSVGFVEILSGNLKRGIDELESYREIDPNYLPINLWLGLAYVGCSRFKDGLEMIETTIRQLPVGKMALSYSYAKAGMQHEALEVLGELEKDADGKFADAAIAGIYHVLGMKERFDYWYAKAISDDGVASKFLFDFYPWFREINQEKGFLETSIGTPLSPLDKFLSSGLPSKSTLLVIGGSEVGKELISYRVITLGLAKGEFCIYVTGSSTREVLRGMDAFGIKISQEDSNSLFWITSEGGALTYVANDLSSLSFNLKGVLKENSHRRIRIVTDILSPLLLLNSTETIYRFLSQLFAEVKLHDAVLVATLEEGMHEPSTIATMKQLFDGYLEVRSEYSDEGKPPTRTVNVRKLRGVSVPGESRSYPL